MSFRCDDCSAEFDRPETLTERDYIDTGIGLAWHDVPIGECCPECGSECFLPVAEGADA